MKVKEIFAEASELPLASRASFLDQACAGDPELRRQVEELLTAFESSGGLLEASSVGEFLQPEVFTTPALQISSTVADRFKIERQIGRGGMGEVYEVSDLQLGGRLALKTIRADLLTRPELTARFLREIRLARKVTHPNICRMLDAGRHNTPAGPIPFVTMELLDGETLATRLRGEPIPHREAIRWMLQIARALQALHAADIIHRDLKPSNVMLLGPPEQTRCVVMDFGIAQTLATEPSHETLTGTGQIVGTPVYMAPEQLLGESVGLLADIYALGIMMYETICGRRPFEAENAVASATAKLAGPPPAPSVHCQIDPRLEDLILACLESNPSRRPSTATAIVAVLEALENKGTGARTRLRLPVYRRRFRRRLLASALLGTTVLAAAGSTRVVRRNLCRTFPGSALVCDLPADKNLAVLPFKINGADASQKALASGFARYLRESLARLAPNPETLCVHLRDDQTTYGMSLALEGDVTARADALEVRLGVRETARGSAGAQPQLLRYRILRFPKNAPDLNATPLRELAKLLDLRYPDPEWQAWTKPVSPESFFSHLRGLGYLNAGDYQKAADAFSFVIDPRRDFAYTPAHVGLASAYRLLANATGDDSWRTLARRQIPQAAGLEDKVPVSGAEREWGEIEAGRPERAPEAIEHFSKALQAWPFDNAVQKSLAAAYEANGQLDKAESVFRDAVTRAPRCWLTYNTLADFYSRQGRVPEAEHSLMEAIRLAPDNFAIYGNLAFIYVKMGRLDDAIDMASKSIEIRPHPILYGTLGRAYLYKGCSSDALLNLRKGVDMADHNNLTQAYAAQANLAEGMHDSLATAEATAVFSRVVELCERALVKNPADLYAQALRALNLARLSRYGEAVKSLAGILRVPPRSNDVNLAAATALEIAGRRREAITLLRVGLMNHLSIHEIRFSPGMSGLAQDPAFTALLNELKLNPTVAPRKDSGCPMWNVPGKGLR